MKNDENDSFHKTFLFMKFFIGFRRRKQKSKSEKFSIFDSIPCRLQIADVVSGGGLRMRMRTKEQYVS